MNKEELHKRISDDIIPLEDGYKYYWIENKGALSSGQLREIANYLDELNASWDAKVKEYFEKLEKLKCTCGDTTAIKACPVHEVEKLIITRA
jgi:hypothetical protein